MADGPAAAPSAPADFAPPPKRDLVFALICMGTFFSQMGLSILMPFFPKEAALRGVSPAALGWIFSIFELAVLVTTPLSAGVLVRCGPRPLLVMFNVLGGLVNIAMGFCWFEDDPVIFTSLCLLLRVQAGFAFAIGVQVSYSLLPCLYGPDFSTATGTLESCSGMAMLIAPVLGATLFGLGGGEARRGFTVPFVTLGAMEMAFGVAAAIAFPALPLPPARRPDLTHFSPKVLVPAFVCVLSGFSLNILEPTLQPHLSQPPLGYSISMLGWLAAAACLSYALLAPLCGAIDDHTEGRYALSLMALGCIVCGIGYCLLGPVPWSLYGWRVPQNDATCWTGVCLIGGGCGFSLIPVFKRTLLYARHDNEGQRQLAATGVFATAYSLGSFCGPTVGGMLCQVTSSQLVYGMCGVSLVILGVMVQAVDFAPGFRSRFTNNYAASVGLLAAQAGSPCPAVSQRV